MPPAMYGPAPSLVCLLILSGISGPFGFFDPLGLTNNLTPGKVRYFREVEVKHGRVAMLGAVGFVLAESFHPLFGGDIDVPSYVAFQATPLQDLWQGVVATIGIIEFFSITQVDGSFEIRDDLPVGRQARGQRHVRPARPQARRPDQARGDANQS